MIYCDDSGWGSLLGGVMIGLYNTDNNKFKCRLIPISYFQGKKFANGLYRQYAKSIFLNMYGSIGESPNFCICKGTILDAIYELVKSDKCIHVKRAEIKDPLQSWLENKFAQSLARIGVPRNSSGAHCLSFDDQLEWIKENPKRIKYVKTGWTKWKTKYSALMNSQ